MADLDRVKRNVQRMITMDAPEADIDEYISSEGTNLEAVRAHKVGAAAAETQHRKEQFFGNYEQRARAQAADARVAKERQEQGPLRTGVRDVLRNIATGTPVGSWLDEANSGLSDVANRVTGGRLGEPYQDRMDYHAAYDRATDADSTRLGFNVPSLSRDGITWDEATAGGLQKLGGGFASFAALPASAGAQLLRYPFSSGAVLGGAYGAGQGQGSDRATNALTGTVVGGVLGKATPFVGKRINNTYNYLADRVRPTPPQLAGYEPGAVNKVLAGVEDSRLFDPKNPQNYSAKRSELGPEGMLGDMSDRLRGQLYAVGRSPGEGQATVRNALMPRAEEAPARIERSLDTTLGPPRNLVQEQERILSHSNAQAKPYYDTFYAKNIPVTPQLEGVLERVAAARSGQSSIMALAERKAAMEGFQGGGSLTGRHIDYIKRALDDVAFDPNTARDDARIFKGLLADLKAAVPDQDWQIARQISGSGQQFKAGVEEGKSAFSRATDPDQQAADLARMPFVKQNGYFEGSRQQVRNIMGEAGTKFGANDDSAALKLLGTKNGQRRLTNLVGPQNARDVSNRVRSEVEFAKTNEAVYGNSATEARQAAKKEFPDAVDVSPAQLPASVGQAGMQIAQKVIAASKNERINATLAREAADAARMLVAQGADRNQIVSGLRRLANSKGTSSATAQLAGDLAEALLRGSSPATIDAFSRR